MVSGTKYFSSVKAPFSLNINPAWSPGDLQSFIFFQTYFATIDEF